MPFWRADAATSQPIQPPPITTSRPPPSKRRADRVRVLDRAQEEHAVEVAAGHGKAPRLAAGGEQQTAVVEPLAARQDDGRRAASIDCTTLEVAQLDVVRGVPALVLLQPGGLLALAAQEVLAERRPLVRTVRLGADEDDAPVEALLAEGLGRLAAGHAGADDDERVAAAHA